MHNKKTVLITGASSGIGQASVLKFVQAADWPSRAVGHSRTQRVRPLFTLSVAAALRLPNRRGVRRMSRHHSGWAYVPVSLLSVLTRRNFASEPLRPAIPGHCTTTRFF